MKSANCILEVNKLSASYGRARILFDVSFVVHPGEVVALMGRNGAGKSTTLKAIAGMLAQRSGSVIFNQTDISKFRPHKISRLGLGWVPEDRRIFTDLSVAENLEVGRQSARPGSPSWTVDQLIEVFPNLGNMLNRPAERMSGGEQQMLTVARTLMGNPILVLLDEPSEGIAPKIVEQMAHMIINLKARGISVVLSEQNMHFAKLVSDRAYILERGEVRYSGTIEQLANDASVQKAYLEF
ncbi:ABC transporter ATP-binding protein [Bradyrhizobium sp. dw_78]|uniref:ABC transporter ATP-binding protein n=1 Tax=Bradyrhizobium sp. dw_78 TaxID=2719793 RepID=UPI001BD502AA|nr:ABC transporter ATP-binding protein [Bradyrhizobium sp. dw_78]